MDISLSGALTRAALRAALAAAVLGALVAGLGDTMLAALLPALRAAVAWAEPAFAVQHLDLSTGPAGGRIRTQVMLAHSLVVGGRVVMPHPLGQAFAWVPAAVAWQLPLLCAVVVAAWPARRWQEWPLRLLGLLLCMPLLMLVDLPVAIVAEFWRPLMAAHDPQGWQIHIAWAAFMHGGGRVWLALLGGSVLVGLCAFVASRMAGLGGRSDVRHGTDGTAGR